MAEEGCFYMFNQTDRMPLYQLNAYSAVPLTHVCGVQVTELFTDNKVQLNQCSLDLTEKQQR